MSALSHFQGFYPQGFGDILHHNVSISQTLPPFNSFKAYNPPSSPYAIPSGIQVVPLYMVSLMTDTVFFALLACPNYIPAMNEFQQQNSDVYLFVDFIMSSTYSELSQIFNSNITNWTQACSLIDVIYSDLANGRYVPFISDELNKNITFIYEFGSFNSGIEQVRISTEAFFREVFGYYDEILSGNSDLKWLSYSGNDINIAPLLQALNFTSQRCVIDNFLNLTSSKNELNCSSGPIFASNLIFEVHLNETTNIQFVKVRFQGNYMNLCEKKQTECEYNEFISRISNTFAPTFQERCGANLPDLLQSVTSYALNEDTIKENTFTLYLLIIVIVSQTLVILHLVKKNKQKDEKIFIRNQEREVFIG